MPMASTVPMVGPTTPPTPLLGSDTKMVKASMSAVTPMAHHVGSTKQATMTRGNSSHT